MEVEIGTYDEKDLERIDMFKDGCMSSSVVPVLTFYREFRGHNVIGSLGIIMGFMLEILLMGRLLLKICKNCVLDGWLIC